MKTDIEISSLDLRHEGQRMCSPSRERQIFLSMVESGITEPLLGVRLQSGENILLDGFKRVRCARKAGIHTAPFQSLGDDEATAIINIIRLANRNAMSLLEQAMFVEELKATHGLSVAEIATRLQKSKAWVSVRLQTLTEMSETTKSAIMSGKFSLYSYLYTLHPFRRLKGSASKRDVDEFVELTSGKGLSTRETERLAGAFFRGGDEMRAQLRSGDLGWCLGEMKRREDQTASADLTELENRCVRDLEIICGCVGRLILKLPGIDVTKPAFVARADLLADQALSRIAPFTQTLREFYDRCRKA